MSSHFFFFFLHYLYTLRWFLAVFFSRKKIPNCRKPWLLEKKHSPFGVAVVELVLHWAMEQSCCDSKGIPSFDLWLMCHQFFLCHPSVHFLFDESCMMFDESCLSSATLPLMYGWLFIFFTFNLGSEIQAILLPGNSCLCFALSAFSANRPISRLIYDWLFFTPVFF